jgi:hypothetical protein
MSAPTPQKSGQSAMHHPRNISEPTSPEPALFQISPTISQLQLQLPEAIDSDCLRSSSHNKRASKVGTEQTISQDITCDEAILSKQATYELKVYEGLFDRTRR